MTYLAIILLLVVTLSSCNNQSTDKSKFKDRSETGIAEFKIIPKDSFEYNTLVKARNDTLEIVTCAEYVIRPFGKINDEIELRNSLLSKFNITSKIAEDSLYHYYTIELNANKLRLFFDYNNEGPDHSYIRSGVINDSSITTINSICIGMNLNSFLDLFFKSYPKKFEDNYKTIILDYCVDDIIHTYSFSNKKLERIEYSMIN